MLKNKRFSFRPIQEYDVRFNRLIFSGLPEEISERTPRRGYIRYPLSTLTEERQAKANAESLISE